MALVVFSGRKRNKEKPALFSLYMVCVLSVSFFYYPTKPLDWGAHTTHPDKGKMTNNFGDGRCCPPVLALSLPPPHGTTSPLPFPSLSTPLSFSLFNLFPISPPNPFHIHTSLSHPSSHLLPLYSFFGVRVCVIFLKPFFKYNRNPSIVFSSSIILSLILSFIIIIYHSLSPLPNH